MEAESPFSFEEIFFSRTDAKGIIMAGNSIFKRVSEFEWSELINRPHNIIRHKEMPRAVFYLLWETIKSGNPIGAYVKNRSKNGNYYWVFALAIPQDGGYISVRLKPSGALFQAAAGEYKKIRQLEHDSKKTPKDSAEVLLSDLASLGFPTYQSFMTAALMDELELRQKAIGQPPIAILAKLKSLLQKAKEVENKAVAINKAYRASALVPMNLEIKTGRIGASAAPLAVVASQYADMAKEVQEGINGFTEISGRTQVAIHQCQFAVCAAILQSEMQKAFAKEGQSALGDFNMNEEVNRLEKLRKSGVEQSVASLKQIDQEFSQFQSRCEELKMNSTGLEIVRLTGRIEAAKILDPNGEFQGLIGELSKFRKFLSETAGEIEVVARDIRALAGAMVGDVAAS